MKISKKQVFSFIFLLVLTLFILPVDGLSSPALAQSGAETSLFRGQEGMAEIGGVYGGKTPQDIRLVVVKFIRLALSFLGLIFLLLIIAAGFKWMTSGGNDEAIGKAKKLLVNSLIGLIIILVAWTITTYLIYVISRIVIDQSIDYLNVQ